MTIEDVIAAVDDFSGMRVSPGTELKAIVSDSLDFVDLILYVSNRCAEIPDEVVSRINTVNDLFLAASGAL